MAEGSLLCLAASEPKRLSTPSFLLEATHPAVERSLGGAGLARPLAHGHPEQRQWAYLLVGRLLGPPAKQSELLPLFGGFGPLSAPPPAHSRSPSLRGAAAVKCPALRHRKDFTRGIYALAGPRPKGERYRTAPAVPIPAMGRRVCGGAWGP